MDAKTLQQACDEIDLKALEEVSKIFNVSKVSTSLDSHTIRQSFNKCAEIRCVGPIDSRPLGQARAKTFHYAADISLEYQDPDFWVILTLQTGFGVSGNVSGASLTRSANLDEAANRYLGCQVLRDEALHNTYKVLGRALGV